MSDEGTIHAKFLRDNLVAEHYRYEKALERIASLKPRPALDPHDCEGRCRRIAQAALQNDATPDEAGATQSRNAESSP